MNADQQRERRPPKRNEPRHRDISQSMSIVLRLNIIPSKEKGPLIHVASLKTDETTRKSFT